MKTITNPIKLAITYAATAPALWGLMWLLYAQLQLAENIDVLTFQNLLFILIGAIGIFIAIKTRGSNVTSITDSVTEKKTLDRIQKLENQTGFFKDEITKTQSKLGDIHTLIQLAPMPEAPNSIEPPKMPQPVEVTDKKTEDTIKKLNEKIKSLSSEKEKIKKERDATKASALEAEKKLEKAKALWEANSELFATVPEGEMPMEAEQT